MANANSQEMATIALSSTRDPEELSNVITNVVPISIVPSHNPKKSMTKTLTRRKAHTQVSTSSIPTDSINKSSIHDISEAIFIDNPKTSIGTAENPNTRKGIEPFHKDSLEHADLIISIEKPRQKKSSINRSIRKLLFDIARSQETPNDAPDVLTFEKDTGVNMSESGHEANIEKGNKVDDQTKINNVESGSYDEPIVEKVTPGIVEKLKKRKAKKF